MIVMMHSSSERHAYVLPRFLVICFVIATVIPSALSIPSVGLSFDADHNFDISVNGASWLRGGDTYFRADNTVYAVNNGTLILKGTSTYNGADSIGQYSATTFQWTNANGQQSFQTKIRAYTTLLTEPHSSSSQIRAVVFEQVYDVGAQSCATGRQSVISSFPSFRVDSPTVPLGYYQWAGQFFWVSRNGGRWNNDGTTALLGGVDTGPLIIFDEHANVTAMIAPLSEFMAASMAVEPVGNSTTAKQISFGPLGNVINVPTAWSMATIVYFSDCGVRCGVLQWGDIYRSVYHKERSVSAADMVNHYIGYNTDRGAYYYFYNHLNYTYEETIRIEKQYATSLNIPYSYWITDSRWYYEDKSGGLLLWTPQPNMFPSGFTNLSKSINYGILLHNRYYSPNTYYAKQNNGNYNFIIEKENDISLPIDSLFWKDLFNIAQLWANPSMLFQDWLYTVSDTMNAINEDITLGKTWLTQMATAASEHHMTIQYCMALARHLLSSVLYPAVTNIRVSNDGMPSSDQWKIGQSALIAYALGVMPFKDNYWTTSAVPTNPYYNHIAERAPQLQSIMATMSTGPVCPGDGIGLTNVSLVMKSIRADGIILQPDEPLVSIDQWFTSLMINSMNDTKWEIMSTYTTLAQQYTWYYVMTVLFDIDLYRITLITPDMLRIDTDNIHYYMHSLQYNKYDWNIQLFNDHTPLTVKNASVEEDFKLFYLSPALDNGIIIFGETSKWVSVSKQRMTSIAVDPMTVTFQLSGAPDELVQIDFAYEKAPATVMTAACQLDHNTGETILIIRLNNTWTCANSNHHQQQKDVIMTV